jgi:hypothetical protein
MVILPILPGFGGSQPINKQSFLGLGKDARQLNHLKVYWEDVKQLLDHIQKIWWHLIRPTILFMVHPSTALAIRNARSVRLTRRLSVKMQTTDIYFAQVAMLNQNPFVDEEL